MKLKGSNMSTLTKDEGKNELKLMDRTFFEREDVTGIAKELLGRFIVSDVNGTRCSGMITETEAYAGRTDRACHAYGGKRTRRTEVMYHRGGTAYVYLCYGIHHLLNVITAPEGIPDAVLIRAVEADEGTETLLQKRNLERPKRNWLGGPGKLTHGFGIRTEKHNGIDLLKEEELWIADQGIRVPENSIERSSRIGIDYAGTDAELPYRFYLPEREGQKILKEARKERTSYGRN
jgi:DNA-3-methyladenine glycosylase